MRRSHTDFLKTGFSELLTAQIDRAYETCKKINFAMEQFLKEINYAYHEPSLWKNLRFLQYHESAYWKEKLGKLLFCTISTPARFHKDNLVQIHILRLYLSFPSSI